MLTQQRVRELLNYDPVTGIIRWRIRASTNIDVGRVAGCRAPTGYVKVRIEGKLYQAHRIIWLHVYGVWPRHHIDHINGNPNDNSLCNLREATVSQNHANARTPVNNTSGYRGVSWERARGKWLAVITANGKRICLGRYINKEEAYAAYMAAARKYHGEFSRILVNPHATTLAMGEGR